MEIPQILKKSLLFSGLDDENLAQVEAIAVKRPFAKGESLFTDGEVANGFYLLAEGSMKLCKISPDGREKVLHFVHAGETFAEAAFFGDGKYPAEAKAMENGEAIFFPREAFMGLLERNPRFSLNLIVSLSLLLRRFARQIEELSFADVPARLAAYLVELAERKSTSFQGKTYIDLDMKKGELASRLGTVSETLSRTFRKLKEEGLIEVDGGRVVVHDMERLKGLIGKGS
ncbi:Crp/Fnr family transcriptional regulator [Geotalea toluenoxydans]|uniref:Crp/Fnr family transcriptional regulator n=1 Tax=Geotalea toluenoxydans TaxID=421624 RepID=UPI0006CF9A1F|nr:Crp/Fnr family transcriptional regulator [Geotalea toluenoxydans]